jgi:hypothetical protein
VTLYQYFRIFFLRSFPVGDVIMNTGPILSGYGAMDIWNSRWYELHVEHLSHLCILQHRKFGDVVPFFCPLCIHTSCFSCKPIHWNLGGVRSGDRSGQFCRPPRPIHRTGNCSFRYSVTCRLKYGVPRHSGSTSVIWSYFLSFKSLWISIHSSVPVKNRTDVHMTFLTGNELTNDILNYWHEVTGHSVCSLVIILALIWCFPIKISITVSLLHLCLSTVMYSEHEGKAPCVLDFGTRQRRITLEAGLVRVGLVVMAYHSWECGRLALCRDIFNSYAILHI